MRTRSPDADSSKRESRVSILDDTPQRLDLHWQASRSSRRHLLRGLPNATEEGRDLVACRIDSCGRDMERGGDEARLAHPFRGSRLERTSHFFI